MPEQFDWQTENEDEWSLPPSLSPSNTTARGRWKGWMSVVLIIAGLLIAGAVVYWRVQDTIDEAEASRTSDILSSHELIEKAIQRNDAELFTTLLSGADLSWATSQQELFRRGWLRDLRAFGLGSAPDEITDQMVEISPELNSATISAILHYRSVTPEVGEQVVSLKKESVYRLGQRWLLSPPKQAFWGNGKIVVEEGRILTIGYPERDRIFAHQLFEDLDRMLSDLCQFTDYLDCPADLRVSIELQTDPSSIVGMLERYFEDGYLGDSLLKPGSTMHFDLPSPTLIGEPINQQSYGALYRAYAGYAAGAIMNRYTDESCCATDRHLQALIQNRLANLGGVPWPMEQLVVSEPPAVDDLNYDLQLMCHSPSAKSIDIFHLDSSTRSWLVELGDRELQEMHGLPDGAGVALLENRIADDGNYQARLFLLVGDQESVLYEGELDTVSAGQIRSEVRDREQQLLLEVPRLEQGYNEYFLYDLNSCDKTECAVAMHTISGKPYWSPDGSQWLIRENGLVWWNQAHLNARISDGFAPFWIDNNQFGYVRQVGDDQYIVVANTVSGEADVITSVDILLDSVPDLARSSQLRIGLVVPNPARPISQWYMLAFIVNRNGRIEEALVLDADVDSGQIVLLHRSTHLNSIAISPGGDRLVTASYLPNAQRWELVSHQTGGEGDLKLTLTAGSSLNHPPTISWSPDDRWLAVVDNGILVLWSQTDGKSTEILPPSAGCMTPAWIRPEYDG